MSISHAYGRPAPRTSAELRAELEAAEARESEEQAQRDAEATARSEARARQLAAEKAAADEVARVDAVIRDAEGAMLPNNVVTGHRQNYDGSPLVDIKHITDRYDAALVGPAPAYRIASNGILVASDDVVDLKTFRAESQLLPESRAGTAARLYAAWLGDKVNRLADTVHREVNGASVLYVAKQPSVTVLKSSEYKGLATIVCEWGDFYVMGMGE